MIQDIEITNEYLTGLLDWSQPRVIRRKGGFKHLFEAIPNEDFEWHWKHNRGALVALGIDRGPVQEGNRTVIWWQDAPEAKDQASELIKASSATDADIEVSVPAGLTLRGYQKACVAFYRGKRALLCADAAGTGKSISTVAIINDHPEWKSVLIICKNVAKINWLREVRKWLTSKLSVWIADPSMFPQRDIVIVNFQLLGKFQKQILDREWDLVVIDECHSIKSPATAQFKHCMAIQKRARNRIGLSGTPIVNEVNDIFQILSWLDPIVYDNPVRFRHHYSEPRRLHDHLRQHIMIRRLKKDVLRELPPVQHRIVEFDDNSPLDTSERDLNNKLAEIEKALENAQLCKDERAYRKALDEMDDALKVGFSEMSEFRKVTGQRKFPFAMEFIKSAMEETEKIVVFAHHRAILESAQREIAGSVLLYGGMDNSEKQLSIDRFQNNPKVPVFFGSILAAGDSITLTAASRVIFFEMDWRPAIMEQCVSRLHRMGQTDSVLVDYLVLSKSCDAKVAKRLTMKMQISEDILDRGSE